MYVYCFCSDPSLFFTYVQVNIGFGVLVSKVKLTLIRSQRPTQMMRQLMDLVFTREEMARSSVTGRSSNKCPDKAPKDQLDPAKVAALLCKSTLIIQ